MALHGNKSQSARTQALAGFKSGDVRALVATDIAARGIDIDDLPHVVNYEIPNVSEDYVHRIGRTGRAGADGQAVNFVCLDEEGFMKDIEAFTKQNIAVQFVEGFGPEAGEKAEPLAMGRQTIWGGLGKPPGRDVMAAAAKAARTDMLNRVRENRAGNGAAPGGRGPAGGGRGGNSGNGGGGRGGRPSQPGQGFQTDGNNTGNTGNGGRPPAQRPAQGGRGRPFGGGGGGFGGGNHTGNQGNQGNGGNGGNGGGDDFQPRNIRHDAGRNVTGFSANNQAQRNSGGQPDPLRTSVDSMAGSGRRGGGNGGGGSFGGNRGGNRTGGGGGGGFAPRGPGGNPPRSFGR
jgi:ATP-dependent RNA helicase RhlE